MAVFRFLTGVRPPNAWSKTKTGYVESHFKFLKNYLNRILAKLLVSELSAAKEGCVDGGEFHLGLL